MTPNSRSDREPGTLRVVFIAGHGRSGSTILDALLAQSAEITGTGELVNLVTGGFDSNEFCACGRPVGDCGFWCEVAAKWTARCGKDAVARFRELNRSVHRRKLPFGWTRSSTQKQDDAQLDGGLIRAIAETSGASTIVDSSKLPARLDALAHIEGIDLRVIHLVRDPASVAGSLSKALSKDFSGGVQADLRARNPIRSRAAWTLANLATEHVIRRHALRACRVRFEDLISNPVDALNRIALATDLDLAGSIEAARSGSAIDFGHTVAGNRVRMQGPVRLQNKPPKPEANEHLPGAGSALITAPLARRYGY